MRQFYIWVIEYRVNSNTVLYCVVIAFPDVCNSIQAIIIYSFLLSFVPRIKNDDRYQVRIRYMRAHVCVCVRMCVNDLNSFE